MKQETIDKWWEWHQQNPHIYRLFEEFAMRAIRYGTKKLSAWLVVNRIRWEVSVETQGDDFKIPNDYIALYSRFFMKLHPEHEGFFTTREIEGLDNATHP